MDRIGVPAGLVRALAVIFVLAGLIILAALLRTMRVSWFYAAGRAVPAPYAGLAFASLAAALFMPFMPPIPRGTSLTSLFAGFACGLACAALVTGPILRKTGAFSLPDLIAARFPRLAARLGAIFLTAAVTILIAIAGYSEALTSLVNLSGLSKPLASGVIAVLLIFIMMPGGLAGTLWTAAAAAIIAVTVFSLPLLITALHGTPLAVPLIGSADLWATALARIETWTSTEASAAAAPAKESMDIALITAIALGVGVLAPLLGIPIGCPDRRAAQRGGFAALFWGGILILLAVTTLAQGSLTLGQNVIGHEPDALPPSLYQASAEGDLLICGASVRDHLAARRACASRSGFSTSLQINDISAKSAFLLRSWTELGAFGSAFAGLISASILALGLALAAIGTQSAATVLGNDMFYRVRDHSALTSRRLAVTRAFMIAILAFGGLTLGLFDISPRTLILLAILLSACALAPLLSLTLWPRATSFDATVTLLAGLLSAEALIELQPVGFALDHFAASALLACAAGLLAGIITSFTRQYNADDGRAFTQAILHDGGEWLHPDKGV
jgi:cation/acetate symporter